MQAEQTMTTTDVPPVATAPTCDYTDSGESLEGWQLSPPFECNAPATHRIPNASGDPPYTHFCDQCLEIVRECGHDLAGLEKINTDA